MPARIVNMRKIEVAALRIEASGKNGASDPASFGLSGQGGWDILVELDSHRAAGAGGRVRGTTGG